MLAVLPQPQCINHIYLALEQLETSADVMMHFFSIEVIDAKVSRPLYLKY